MSKQIAITGYTIAGKPDPKEFAFPISVQKVRRSYRVAYGVAVYAELNYGDACRELGAAIMHALQCDGAFDDEESK